ncbi:OB-fold domain-containing protein [Microbacterium pseudoresistens]|uniref:DNA-binding protein n=1 Tax=Microbacterium pseudoresistens TaxID=640634 RepID=A0A7Y9EVA8_9MICO|nr:hypothetical protein [Microbacterium pseudoresistens]
MTSTETPSPWEVYGNWAEGKPLVVGPWSLGLYQPAPESVAYWEAVERRELRLPRCVRCETFHHPRRLVCFSCDAEEFEWTLSSGRATVYSFTTVHRDLSGVGGPTPYDVGIVRTEEGVHLFTRFVNRSEKALRIDDAVEVDFEELPIGFVVPVFVKASVAAETTR